MSVLLLSCYISSGLNTLRSVDWAQPIARIITSACVIVLTWIKTFDIHKEASRLGMRTPLATLLLRDGEFHVRHVYWHAGV